MTSNPMNDLTNRYVAGNVQVEGENFGLTAGYYEVWQGAEADGVHGFGSSLDEAVIDLRRAQR